MLHGWLKFARQIEANQERREKIVSWKRMAQTSSRLTCWILEMEMHGLSIVTWNLSTANIAISLKQICTRLMKCNIENRRRNISDLH